MEVADRALGIYRREGEVACPPCACQFFYAILRAIVEERDEAGLPTFELASVKLRRRRG